MLSPLEKISSSKSEIGAWAMWCYDPQKIFGHKKTNYTKSGMVLLLEFCFIGET